jgi:hypothetical protein
MYIQSRFCGPFVVLGENGTIVGAAFNIREFFSGWGSHLSLEGGGRDKAPSVPLVKWTKKVWPKYKIR